MGRDSERAFVVLMRIHLYFPEAGSLKAKRSELNRVKAHLRERMGASVSEVAQPLRRGRRPGRADARRAVPAGRPHGAARRLME